MPAFIEKIKSKLIIRYPDSQTVTVQMRSYGTLLGMIVMSGFFLFVFLSFTPAFFDRSGGFPTSLDDLTSNTIIGLLVILVMISVFGSLFLRMIWQVSLAFERFKVDGSDRRIRGYIKTYAEFSEVKHVYVRHIHVGNGKPDQFLLAIRLRNQHKIMLGEHSDKEEAENAGIKMANLIHVPFEQRK